MSGIELIRFIAICEWNDIQSRTCFGRDGKMRCSFQAYFAHFSDHERKQFLPVKLNYLFVDKMCRFVATVTRKFQSKKAGKLPTYINNFDHTRRYFKMNV